jgi:restriction system protein
VEVNQMAIWLVRAGRDGAHEEFVLENGIAASGWDELPDLSAMKSREELEALFWKALPQASPPRIANYVGQVWAFIRSIQDGDLVALPLKRRAAVAIGQVTGPYRFRPDAPPGTRHQRPVEWLRQDIPRNAFEQDLLYSLGAFMTVCRIKRNNAEERIRAILEGRPAPAVLLPQGTTTAEEGADATVPPDLEQYALDQIRAFIGTNFKGHKLADLVDALLNAQGYRTEKSPPGPDGGVDIIAGRGPLGFEPPRLCVQVKSSDETQDVDTFRNLHSAVTSFRADQGLLIAWGGFKRTTLAEAKHHFFQVRLWDAGDLVEAVLQEYDKLPEDIQAELPLKRIWSIVAAE